jgi:hypothetical protein
MLERAIGTGAIMTPLPFRTTAPTACSALIGAGPSPTSAPTVRSAISSFARIDAEAGLAKLRADLSSGRWAERTLRSWLLDALDLGYRIVRCEIGGAHG